MTGWATQRVLVVGTGRSGTAAARALLRRGAAVTVVDSATTPKAEEAGEALRRAGATVQLGITSPSLDAATLVVPSPGVVEAHPLLRAAQAAGIPVWSEPELAWQLNGGRIDVLAVTGTNGKTTTTELIGACLGAPTAGNIGTPLADLLDSDAPPPMVVAELSSFQLRFTDTFRPRVAALLNVAPDHLDWHGNATAYQDAKARIWRNQTNGDAAVVNVDDAGARATVGRHAPPAAVVEFTAAAPRAGQVGVDGDAIVSWVGDEPVEVVPTTALGVAGPHNVANVCAAVAVCAAAGADVTRLAGPLGDYRPGRHRLETVATVHGVQFVDDSKATNPHAAAAALASFPGRRVVWIAGGLGKGLEFDSLAELVRRHVHTAVTIGTSGPQIAQVARTAGALVVEAGTLDRAVAAAADAAQPGDTVLLAPACASMDQFVDYAARGDAFRAAVQRLGTPVQGAAGGR